MSKGAWVEQGGGRMGGLDIAALTGSHFSPSYAQRDSLMLKGTQSLLSD